MNEADVVPWRALRRGYGVGPRSCVTSERRAPARWYVRVKVILTEVWDNSYFLSGFDWLSEEAVSYKLPSHSASTRSPAEGQCI